MRERISKVTEWLMFGTAVFFDLLSIIPIVNWIIFVLTPLTFGLWFLMHNAGWVGFINTKKLKGDVAIYIIEVIPVLSMLPGITIRIYRSIKMIQSEDKEYNKKQSEKNKRNSVAGRAGASSKNKH